MPEPNKNAPGKKKTGFAKYQWWILGGFAGLVIIYFVMKSSGGASSTSATASPIGQGSDIDPQTGYLAGSAADLAALGEGSAASENGSSGTTNNYYGSAPSTTNLPAPSKATPVWAGTYQNQGATFTSGNGNPTILLNGGLPGPIIPNGGGWKPTTNTSHAYTATPMDNLGTIAAAHNVPIESLAQANSTTLGASGRVLPGMRLTIPR